VIRKLLYAGLAALLITQGWLLLPQASKAYADTGLELHWNLDEGSGSVAIDSSGNSNDGTLFNNPTYVPGVSGTAVSLNGIDQYIQSDNPLASLGTINQPYALSAWVKVPAGVTQGNIVHISSSQDGSGWCIPFLRLEGDVFTATGWDENGNPTAAVGTTLVQPDVWYQVLTSWDPVNGLRLFVNGNLEAQTPQTGYNAAGSPVYFSLGLGNGACSEDQGFLNGIVDDARVYSRALTPADIQNILAVGNPPSIPAPTTVVVDPATLTAKAPDTGFGIQHSSIAPLIIVSGLALLLVLGGSGIDYFRYRRQR